MNIFSAAKAAILLISVIYASQVNAYTQIYFFGDSLSDTGNAKVFSGNQNNPYFPERFSNGKVAVDFLAEHYGLYATPSLHLLGNEFGNNYSVGGARAVDGDGDESTPDTHLPTQINSFLALHGGAASPENLYVVIIGGNDLFHARDLYSKYVTEPSAHDRRMYQLQAKNYVDLAVQSTLAQISKLVSAGAKNLLVANAPNIAYVPATYSLIDTLVSEAESKIEERRAERIHLAAQKLSNQFNRKLAKGLKRMGFGGELNLIQWDLSGFLENKIEEGSSSGYTNVDQPCQQLQSCDGFVFYDSVHPTSQVHKEAVQAILSVL